MLRLQRPEKTSRTSSKPPATDRKEQREQAKPGGAKPGHEGHSRTLSDDPDEVVEHRPDRCSCCGGCSAADLPAEIVSVSERIELPEVDAGGDPASAAGGALPVLRDARRRARAAGSARHAVRATAARGGDLSEDLPGALLRAAAGARLPTCSGSRSARAG